MDVNIFTCASKDELRNELEYRLPHRLKYIAAVIKNNTIFLDQLTVEGLLLY